LSPRHSAGCDFCPGNELLLVDVRMNLVVGGAVHGRDGDATAEHICDQPKK
jgi:hypothetical protein